MLSPSLLKDLTGTGVCSSMSSRCIRLMSVRVLSRPTIGKKSTTTSKPASRKRRKIDETTIAGAQHRASFSGPSLGYLIAELSATRPGMTRIEGQTMMESHRTLARKVTQWVIGLPVAVGTALVGINWMRTYQDP